MCLRKVWARKEKGEWLKDKPDTIIAYKVVHPSYSSHKYKNIVFPPVFGEHGNYPKHNKMLFRWRKIRATDNKKYKPYYHLFIEKREAETWQVHQGHGNIVLKCIVPKKAITAMGIQGFYHSGLVIVTKKFTFVEGEQFFEKRRN